MSAENSCGCGAGDTDPATPISVIHPPMCHTSHNLLQNSRTSHPANCGTVPHSLSSRLLLCVMPCFCRGPQWSVFPGIHCAKKPMWSRLKKTDWLSSFYWRDTKLQYLVSFIIVCSNLQVTSSQPILAVQSVPSILGKGIPSANWSSVGWSILNQYISASLFSSNINNNELRLHCLQTVYHNYTMQPSMIQF